MPTSRPSSSPRRDADCAWWRPTACSRWTATSRRSPRSRPSATSTADAHGGRQPRDRLRRQDRPRQRGALRRAGPRGVFTARSQGARRRVGAVYTSGGRRSSTCCASARGRISSATRCLRRSSPPHTRASTCSRSTTICATAWGQHRRFAKGDDQAASRSARACTDRAGLLGEAKLATAIADDLLNEGIYVVGFFFPVCPQGHRPHPACSSPPRTPTSTSTARSRRSEGGEETRRGEVTSPSSPETTTRSCAASGPAASRSSAGTTAARADGVPCTCGRHPF